MNADEKSTPGDPVVDADRFAIESIAGRKLPDEWPNDAWPAGSRVRVIQDSTWKGPWAETFTGTVSSMAVPEPVTHPRAQSNELAYWVEFDEPQVDGAGDGPYRKAQIWGRYLELL